MKKNLLLSLFLLCVHTIFAQSHNFKIHPFSLVKMMTTASVEHSLSQHISLSFTGYYNIPSSQDYSHGVRTVLKNTREFANLDIETMGFIPEFRYYYLPKQGNMRGAYVSAYLRYELSLSPHSHYNTFFTSFEWHRNHGADFTGKIIQHNYHFGSQLGYQFILKKHFSIDMFVGGSFFECLVCRRRSYGSSQVYGKHLKAKRSKTSNGRYWLSICTYSLPISQSKI